MDSDITEVCASMSFVGDMFDSSKGVGFKGNGMQNITEAATKDQADAAYNKAIGAIDQQQAFVDALAGSNGVQNLSDMFHAYGQIAAGGGPNPAAEALKQQTAANTANQAALMAGQRGAGQNAGLIARQAAQMGSANQQNAIGQAATLQAQQQLAAMGQQSAIAQNQVSNQAGGLSGLNQYAQNEQANLLNAIAQQNAAKVGMQSNINNVEGAIARDNASSQRQMFGQVVGGIAGGAMGGSAGAMQGAQLSGLVTKAHGGLIKMAGGGGVTPPDATVKADTSPLPPAASSGGGGGMDVAGMAAKYGPMLAALNQGGEVSHDADLVAHLCGNPMATGGPVRQILPPSPVIGEQLAASGMEVPGKAKVSGDSLKNDIVDAKLSPGEIVIPRSIAQGPDAPKKAAEFVAAVLARSTKSKSRK